MAPVSALALAVVGLAFCMAILEANQRVGPSWGSFSRLVETRGEGIGAATSLVAFALANTGGYAPGQKFRILFHVGNHIEQLFGGMGKNPAFGMGRHASLVTRLADVSQPCAQPSAAASFARRASRNASKSVSAW